MGELCFKCGKDIEKEDDYFAFEPLCKDCYENYLEIYKGVRIYRFISPDVFFSMLKKKKLMFSLPSRWEDSFEDIFFKVFLDARKAQSIDPILVREMLATRDTYYCQCWTLTPEAQFFWGAYGYEGDAIRIEIDLEDAFKMGLRIEPVRYSPIPSKKDWIKEEEYFGVNFARGDEKDIYRVDEDGYYVGNIHRKTSDMRYASYIIGVMRGIHEPECRLEPIPIPKIIATKQPKFMVENEVRLFIPAWDFHNLESIYFKRHMDYVNRVYANYDVEDADIETHMPVWKSFSYAINKKFIKSVLCHPYMSDEIYGKVVKQIKENNLIDIFKGRSKIFEERV